MFDNVFKNKMPITDKLLSFGFILENDTYIYRCKIVNEQFDLTVWVSPTHQVHAKITDPGTEDEYTLHLVPGVVGSFIGKVRSEYLNILQNIADNCFETKIFQSDFADKIIQYVEQKYHHAFEYLWEKFPENAIVRRADNQKWYAAILTVVQNKIGLTGDKKIEVIDLRMQPEKIEQLVDGKKYFPGYHMNKKHWITLLLDGTVPLQEIYTLIDNSYLLASSTSKRKNVR